MPVAVCSPTRSVCAAMSLTITIGLKPLLRAAHMVHATKVNHGAAARCHQRQRPRKAQHRVEDHAVSRAKVDSQFGHASGKSQLNITGLLPGGGE